MQEMMEENQQDGNGGFSGAMFQELAFAIPGVDEAMGFSEVMKYIPS
jgi:arsenite-transporting ATPase